MEGKPSIWGSARDFRFIAYWVVGGTIVWAISNAFGDRHFFSSFGSWLLAIWVHLILVFGTLAGGIAVGVWVAGRSKVAWLGWIAGIGTFAALVVVGAEMIDQFPNLKWRIDAMSTSSDDY